MDDIKKKSKELASNPEVVEALKVLSKYGAGVLLVHGHADDGSFKELPPSIVAYEEDLVVSFRKPEAGEDEKFVTVAWRWDEDSGQPQPVMKCQVHAYCEDRIK